MELKLDINLYEEGTVIIEKIKCSTNSNERRSRHIHQFIFLATPIRQSGHNTKIIEPRVRVKSIL